MFNLVAPSPIPMMYQNNASFDGGNFKVYWSYNSSADSLYLTVDVAATGWIGFGFSENTGGMMGYDVVVGGVGNGQMYLKVGFFFCSCSIHAHIFSLVLGLNLRPHNF